jgi:D-alanyl-D-alanine carboxypeptidase (penicillin-binding protein 5/6)
MDMPACPLGSLPAEINAIEKNWEWIVEKPFDEDEDEMRRRMRRMKRRQAIRRRKRRQALMRRIMKTGIAFVMMGLLLLVMRTVWRKINPERKAAANIGQEFLAKPGKKEQRNGLWALGQNILEDNGQKEPEDGEKVQQLFQYEATEDTHALGEDEITSSYAVFVDTESDTILASRDAFSRMVPASMTKVLTALIAAEHVENWDDKFTITIDITDYSFQNHCSNAGFDRDETVTIRDLIYGAILPSGADASLGLAVYVAGSQEAFVELMNEKLEELGLSETSHFTNCVGIYDVNHYTTAYDMAVIMEAAIQNEMCREVFSTRIYTTSVTEQHPEGIEMSNWFVRRIEDKETNGIMVYGKTGYVDESGSCAVSFGTNENGRTYICVTANSGSKWWCIDDHAKLYLELTE